MAERHVNVGGFRLSVAIPDGAARALGRRRRGPSGGDGTRLVVRDPPPLSITQRDPELGLGFIADRIQRRASAPVPTSEEDSLDPGDGGDAGDGGDLEPAALARAAAAQPWYHTIELPHGVVTKGSYDHRPLVGIYGIPGDLQGQRALDVGTADGFWAFELERRGAKVTALDIESTAEVDLPARLARLATERGYADPLGDGFALAHRALHSEVERIRGTVYDLDPDRLGRFDLVHAGDLLVHVRNPTQALEQIRAVTNGVALISDVFDPKIGWPEREESSLIRHLGGWVSAGWSTPAFGTLVQMVADAGFSSVEVVTVYSLVPRWEIEGPWRVVLRARP
jgi:tRNA (mo5U34)-methyltransferase